MLRYSICNCSRSSNTAKVLSCKATAQVSMTAYVMMVRQSMELFKQ